MKFLPVSLASPMSGQRPLSPPVTLTVFTFVGC